MIILSVRAYYTDAVKVKVETESSGIPRWHW